MIFTYSLFTSIISTLVLISHLILFAYFILFITQKYISFLSPFYQDIRNFIKKHVLLLSFIVSLVATLGSLFYSDIAGFNPCKLCWFQRIFMYPMVFLFGLALFKREKCILPYAFLLALIGILISTYHYGLQVINTFLFPIDRYVSCEAAGMTAQCTGFFFFKFGYITIPMMCFTAFALILFFLSIARE